MPGTSSTLHPLHGGTGRAVPTCVTEGPGQTWVVNKGLFSPGWESLAGVSGGTGGCLEEAPWMPGIQQ